jgi:hypothetical protein
MIKSCKLKTQPTTQDLGRTWLSLKEIHQFQPKITKHRRQLEAMTCLVPPQVDGEKVTSEGTRHRTTVALLVDGFAWLPE